MLSWKIQTLIKNGHIDFEEFLKVTAHKLIDLGDNHDLESNRKAFDKFDLDKDGFINREELFRALGVIDPTLTEEDRIRMLENSDVNLDGKISFEEFVTFQQ
ncbi:hypothetical protein DSO57_1015758 [Entomophthora muscae]|uniref:Uncharacterized protein n=1 Tax=Entomophthora muscae TaxID=34485 RepID=A0ACC2SI45_9FUNG|nr:hypothetical protein DSO57_1015758 [Entomophthora muscae]